MELASAAAGVSPDTTPVPVRLHLPSTPFTATLRSNPKQIISFLQRLFNLLSRKRLEYSPHNVYARDETDFPERLPQGACTNTRRRLPLVILYSVLVASEHQTRSSSALKRVRLLSRGNQSLS
jgi:hypothetical protein